MKNFSFPNLVVGTVVLIIIAGMPLGVLADEWLIGFDLGRFKPSGTFGDHFDNDYSLGLTFEYLSHEYFGILTSVHYASLDAESKNTSNFSMIDFMLDGELSWPFAVRWRAFAAGGIGVYVWDSPRAWWLSGESKQGIDLGYNYGMGLKYRFAKHFDACLSYFRHSVKFKDDDSSSTWSDWQMGVRYAF